MDDRRRHLQLLAFTFGPALDIIHVYFENKVLHNTNLNFFLNDHLKKHQLFHEYIPRIPCCKGSSCSIANPNKQGCLDKRQFFFLFESNSSIQPNHEIKKGKVITQHCLCQYSAKISVTVDDLDITLISALIQTCCVPGTIPGNPRWLTDIREVRNDVVHNGKGEINNTEFTNLWTKLETAVLEFASLIAGPLKKLYKKQIDEIKTKSIEDLSKVINDSSEKTVESFILSNNGISTSFVALHENIKTAIQNNADNMKNTLEKTTTLLNESQELSRAEIVKEVHNTHTNMMKTIASETSDLKGHVTDEQKSLKQMVQKAIATSTFEVKKEIQRGKAHFSNEAAKTGKRNNNLIKGISRKLGMLTEEVRQLKAQIAINESAKGTNNDLKNGQLKDIGTHRIKAEAEIDSVIIDEDKTLQRIPSVQKDFNKEQFHIESSDKKCILLKMSADPLIFKDENSLRSAIRSLIEKVIEAAEIDVSIDNTIDVSLTFTSPLTTDQRETVYSLLSKCGGLNDNENSVERLQQDASALQSSISRKRLEDLPEIYDSISYSKSEPVELVQITVNNIEFEVQVKGFPKEKENEKIMYDSESETLYVHWTLDCPKDWNLKSIKETMKNMESKYVGCFRIDVFYSDMFDRLSLDTATQRNVVNTFLCMELEIQTFLEQIVESCQIKSETPSDVSVIVTILPGADKNADDIDVDELTEDDNLVNCRHCKHTFVCTKCTKMAKKMAALKTILYLKTKNIEDLQADLKNTDTTNKEDAKGSETEGSEFETEEDIFKGTTMSDAKTTLMFREFSDLCRGSIGYSHNMVALFDRCDFGKHFRHPISFIEAVERLKTSIKLLFERLERESKKHVAEYEIETYCLNSDVGKTINHMKPTTSPVVIEKQCDGMIFIACITEELIPKVIMENKKNDTRMDPHVYVHGLNQALIQHFTFNSPDNRLQNKTYDYNMKKLSSVKAAAIYVTYKFRQESTETLLTVKDVQEENVLKLQLEEIGLQYCGNIQQDDGNSFFLACVDQLKCLGYDLTYLELKQMVIQQLKLLHETDYLEFTRTDWHSYIDRLSNDANECIRDVVVRTTGSCLKQNIIIYCRGTSNEPVKKSFPREGIATSIILAEENNYYISLKKIQHGHERTGIKRPADINHTPETPIKKVHFKAERPGFENRENPLTTSKLVNKKGTTMVITTQSSADSQVPSVSSTLQETTVQSESHQKREPATAQPHMATYTLPTQKYKLANEPKSPKKKTKKMTKDEKILILNCYNELDIKTDYDVLAEQVYKKRKKCLSRELVQHYENNLDVSTTLKSRIKSYIQRIQKGKDNETDQEVTDLIMKSGLITTGVTMQAEKLVNSMMGL